MGRRCPPGLGLRREEVLALRWDDVDGAVHVRRTLTYAAGEIHFGPPKSAAGESVERDSGSPKLAVSAGYD